jgi:hypothetical protein
LRRPLPEECLEPFPEIAGHDTLPESVALGVELRRQIARERVAHETLDPAHRDRRTRGDAACQLLRLVLQRVDRNDAVDETQTERVLGRERLSEERDLQSLAQTNNPRQRPGCPGVATGPDVHVSEIEACSFGCDRQICSQRQAQTCAGHDPVEARNDWSRQRREQGHARVYPVDQSGGSVEGVLPEQTQIAAGDERPPLAAHHDDADGGIGGDCAARGQEGVRRRDIDRIEHRRAIEEEVRDVLFPPEEEWFSGVAHVGCLSLRASALSPARAARA